MRPKSQSIETPSFTWNNLFYEFTKDESAESYIINVALDEKSYKMLALRYKELFGTGDGSNGDEDVPYDIEGYLTAIDTDMIDSDYMNTRFEKFLKILRQEGDNAEALKQAVDELHKTFATLTQEEPKYANIFLHDIQRGDVVPEGDKTLRDYITEYMTKAKDDQLHRFAEVFGLDEQKLRALMALQITEGNINEFGRFDALKATVDKQKAKAYFEKIEGKSIIPPKIPVKIDKILREFILRGGFEIKKPN